LGIHDRNGLTKFAERVEKGFDDAGAEISFDVGEFGAKFKFEFEFGDSGKAASVVCLASFGIVSFGTLGLEDSDSEE
jgi:hypothetical protein